MFWGPCDWKAGSVNLGLGHIISEDASVDMKKSEMFCFHLFITNRMEILDLYLVPLKDVGCTFFWSYNVSFSSHLPVPE